MRLIVIHDIQGNIASIAASPPDLPVMHLKLKTDQSMTQVDAPELKLDDGIDYINKHLANLMENYIIATENSKGKLTKKSCGEN